MRASTSGPEGSMFDASTRASAAAARNCVSASSSTCSPMRCSMSARSSASVSNSLAERASSSSTGGRIFSFTSLSAISTVPFWPSASSYSTCLVSPADIPTSALLDLLEHAAGADLDDVVALRLAAGLDEVDDHGVAGLGGPVGGRELGDCEAQRLDLLVDEPRAGRPRRAQRNLEPLPVGDLDLRLDVHGGGEAEVLVRCVRQLVVVLRPGDGPNRASRRARSGTSPRCGSRPPPSRAAPCRSARRSTCIGTFPLRKPGIFTDAERSEAACSTACCTSWAGTSTVRRTLFSGNSSTRAGIGAIVAASRGYAAQLARTGKQPVSPVTPFPNCARTSAAALGRARHFGRGGEVYAGGGTRTPKSRSSPGPKPGAVASFATPATPPRIEPVCRRSRHGRLRPPAALGRPRSSTGEKSSGAKRPDFSTREEGVTLDARCSTIPPVIEPRLFPGEGG